MLLTLVAVVAAVLIVLALFVAGVIPGLNAGSNGSASHSVTFSQTGLPAGTSWSVTLGGATQSSTGTILFSEKNGNYSFSVPAVTGYTQSPASGYVVVSGTPLSEAITFSGSTPLGTEFAWGSPVNATGSTPPGCTSAVDHYCYTIEIAAAGSAKAKAVAKVFNSDQPRDDRKDDVEGADVLVVGGQEPASEEARQMGMFVVGGAIGVTVSDSFVGVGGVGHNL